MSVKVVAVDAPDPPEVNLGSEKPKRTRTVGPLTELQVMQRMGRMLDDLKPRAAQRVLTYLVNVTGEKFPDEPGPNELPGF